MVYFPLFWKREELVTVPPVESVCLVMPSQREHKNWSNIMALHSFCLSTVSYLCSNCPHLHIHSDSVILGKDSREAYFSSQLPETSSPENFVLKGSRSTFSETSSQLLLGTNDSQNEVVCKMIFRLTDSLCDGFATEKAVTMA